MLLHRLPRCGGCCYTMYQGVVDVVTPCTKVWWLLLHHVPRCGGCCYTVYQGVVVVVAQLNINSDNFAQRHQKKDVQKHEKQDL